MTARSCACGAAIKHPTTGECGTCYGRRWRAERRAAMTCTKCGQTGIRSDTEQLCEPCLLSARRARRATEVSYDAAHQRVRADRGPASAWHCIACGRRATEWAYREGSLFEQHGIVDAGGRRRRMRWSSDSGAYDPMCRTCHGQRDRAGYGKGKRRDRAHQLRWQRDSYHRAMADPDKRAARNARQRDWRASQRSTASADFFYSGFVPPPSAPRAETPP